MCGSWAGYCLRDRAGPGMGWDGGSVRGKDALRQRFYAGWRNFNRIYRDGKLMEIKYVTN